MAGIAGNFQKTIARAVSRSGAGLHTGITAHLKLLPAAAGEGRYFIHCSEDGGLKEEEVRIPASIHFVKETNLSICIGKGSAKVRTVEHLLSALEGLNVHNCRIEIHGGDEVPLFDGSARIWIEAIREAGVAIALNKEGNKLRHIPFSLVDPIHVVRADSFIAAFPSQERRLTYGIDFEQVSAIGKQWFSACLDSGPIYEEEVAPARTFCIAEQIASMQAAGLIKGGSLDNAIVCSSTEGWLNPPLRFSDEPCRHKMLDLVGDLALCAENGNSGIPNAHIVAYKAGHLLHTMFGHALLKAKEAQKNIG